MTARGFDPRRAPRIPGCHDAFGVAADARALARPGTLLHARLHPGSVHLHARDMGWPGAQVGAEAA
jgi:hypothetical protein